MHVRDGVAVTKENGRENRVWNITVLPNTLFLARYADECAFLSL